MSHPQCGRNGCPAMASALLAYDVSSATARLVDLADAPVGTVPLCHAHAARVTVPRGWTLTDERSSGLMALFGGGADDTTADGPAGSPQGRMLQRAFRVLPDQNVS